jgi:hypothetical protein
MRLAAALALSKGPNDKNQVRICKNGLIGHKVGIKSELFMGNFAIVCYKNITKWPMADQMHREQMNLI